jgi:hypothetical protein
LVIQSSAYLLRTARHFRQRVTTTCNHNKPPDEVVLLVLIPSGGGPAHLLL